MNNIINACDNNEQILDHDLGYDSFDALESQLEAELDEKLQDLGDLEEDFKKMGNPESLGTTVMDVVREQFINQIGVVAGEDFIEENRNLRLDLRNSAHIQTTDNFAKGKIATHNTSIDYKKRYEGFHSNFQHDENNKIKTHTARNGKQEATLVKGARNLYDRERPVGSKKLHIDVDHTVSAAEIMRDPGINAHMTKEEQIAFANSSANLNAMNASHNRSKGDKTTTEWLGGSNANGQKPNEIFNDLTPEQEKEYKEKDRQARKKLAEEKGKGEKRSIETGKKSQKAEALRIGKKALRAVIMGLLAELIKNIIQKLISWIRSGSKKMVDLTTKIKEAIHVFIGNLKQKIMTAGKTVLTTIFTAIWGPIIGLLTKVGVFLKQGYKSIKEAIQYIKKPENRTKSFSVLLLEISKIIVVGLTGGAAIMVGQVIEKSLLTIPLFAIQIPFLGSLASLLGIFFGAVGMGIIGALVLNWINKKIIKRQRKENTSQQIDKSNEILTTQQKLQVVVKENVNQTKTDVFLSMKDRRSHIKKEMENMAGSMMNSIDKADKLHSDVDTLHDENNDALDDIYKDLETI